MDIKLNFLIAEDDPVSRTRLKRFLERSGYTVIAAKDGPEGWRLFQREKDRINFAILDQGMSRLSGIELCKQIKSSDVSHYIYVILLSAKEDTEDIVSGFKAGADDYITKPFDNEELISRIKVGQRIIALEKKLKTAYQKLHRVYQKLRIAAVTDSLTGFLNRGALFERLGRELLHAYQQDISLCLVMLDIDHFKRINDTHGHLFGDEILKSVAQRLKGAVRPYDFIGRYGGEEFLIVLIGVDENVAYSVAERIRRTISDREFEVNGLKLSITVSLGVVPVKVSEHGDIESLKDKLLLASDRALYKAKEEGRNRVVMAKPTSLVL